MTPKDFFRVMLKILGLYFIVITISSISYFSYLFVGDIQLETILIIIAVLLIFIIVFAIFTLKPDILINLLNLDKGFDKEKFDFRNVNDEYLIRISSIILGGILIINSLPLLLSHMFFAFKINVINGYYDDKFELIVSLINFFLGIILISSNKMIYNFLKNKQK